MKMPTTDLDAWLAYFSLLQEIADEVGLDDNINGIIEKNRGGRHEGT